MNNRVQVQEKVARIDHRSAGTGPLTVHYQVAGAGQPLVLLHGLSGSGRWWDKNILALAQQFRVYVIDLVGFGRGRGQRFVLRDASQVIGAWLDQVGIDQFSIAGHSMGGFIAADLASHRPQQVDRLVLVDAAAVPIAQSFIRVGFGLMGALRYMPFDFLPVLFTDALRAGPFTLTRAAWEILRADFSANLVKIESDTLIVWGERDTLLPLEMGHRLREALPRAEFVVIKGAGHNPMWDRPDRFNQVVTQFLNHEKIS